MPKQAIGDAFRLRQVLLNLISNAVKFTERGSIHVEARLESTGRERAVVRYSVQDTGIGLAREQQKYIFEAFRQGDGSTTRRYGGTGLGLAICSSLVQMMDGHIWVESEPGHGSVFCFTASFENCAAPPEALRANGLTKLAASLEARKTTDCLSILVAEDNAINQRLAMRLLEKRGHSVRVAGTGREAVEAVKSQSFDLVLMDVQMPEMDGLEATRQIREFESAERVPAIPIIAMTAYAMAGDRDRCLAAGMDAYISKPVKADELVAVIESVLAGRTA